MKVSEQAPTAEYLKIRRFNQQSTLADVLKWDGFTELQVRVALAVLDFFLHNGQNTGGYLCLDQRSTQWTETMARKSKFRDWADTQKICSSRYVRVVLRKLIDLGFAKPHIKEKKIRKRGRLSVTIKMRVGYGLDVEALRRYRTSYNQFAKYLRPLELKTE